MLWYAACSKRHADDNDAISSVLGWEEQVMGSRLIDHSVMYRDIFGAWRWEYRDGEGHIRDSAQSYDNREDCMRACVEAARAEEAGNAAAPGPARTEAQITELAARVSSRSILCVQPDARSRQGVEETLAAYDTVFVTSGYEALRSLNSGVFDAYVLDYWLPDWSGVQLCRDIRKSDPHGPICFYTTAAAESHRMRAQRAGASAYIGTTVDPRALALKLRDLFVGADIESLRAKVEEERAVQAELARRAQVVAERTQQARVLAAEAAQRAARAKAFQAFIASGGTKANFSRWWPNVFGSAAANLR